MWKITIPKFLSLGEQKYNPVWQTKKRIYIVLRFSIKFNQEITWYTYTSENLSNKNFSTKNFSNKNLFHKKFNQKNQVLYQKCFY